jgi:hypothetical protein
VELPQLPLGYPVSVQGRYISSAGRTLGLLYGELEPHAPIADVELELAT